MKYATIILLGALDVRWFLNQFFTDFHEILQTLFLDILADTDM